MKTVLITVAEPGVTAALLRGSFWQALRAGPPLRIVVVTQPDRVAAYASEFGGESVAVEGLHVRPGTAARAVSFVAENTLRTGTVTFNHWRQYAYAGGRLSLFVKRALWRFGGSSRRLQALVRFFSLHVPPDAAVRRLFERYRPDVVFSTIMINQGIDVPVLREARRRKISSIGMLRGWDNLTSHGFLEALPERLLLQNRYLENKAVALQHIPVGRIAVVGFPLNDWYHRRDLIVPRETFLRSLGIDPKKRLILYGAMGEYLFRHEEDIPAALSLAIEQGRLPRDCVILFRAHPRYASSEDNIRRLPHVVWDRSATYLGSRERSWEMGEAEIAKLMNSIAYSEMVVTAGSTMALDAIAFGKPAISVAFETTPCPYWFSARRFRDHYTHFEDLMATGGVRSANSPEELVAAIQTYLNNPAADAAGRERARELFLAPDDGQCGERIAAEIKSLL